MDGHSLNDRPRLAKVVATELANLLKDDAPSEESILQFLNGNEGRKEIEEALLTLQRLGVYGIPKFIIEGQTVVDGAARSDVFVNIFREIEKRGEIAGGPIFGQILGVPEVVIEKGSHRTEDIAA